MKKVDLITYFETEYFGENWIEFLSHKVGKIFILFLNKDLKYVSEVINKFGIQQHYHEFSYKELIDLVERSRFSFGR